MFTALGHGDKKTYLDTFWNSPRLVIRVANDEWRGIEAIALGRNAAVVTSERPAPGGATGAVDESLIFRVAAAFIRTAEGWKIVAWHAHSVAEKSSAN